MGNFWSKKAKDRKAITVLYSEPLVYEDTRNNLIPLNKLNFPLERDRLCQCLDDTKSDIELSFDSATHQRLLVAKALRPKCLHYSGHGHEDRGTHLPFEDGKGASHWLNARVLGDLIAKDEGQPFKLVVVSACHSRDAGEVFVAAGVPHVVCCKQESEIKDDAAQVFSSHFYLALAAGETVKEAFQDGCRAVRNAPNRPHAEYEAEKFLLLPRDGDHKAAIFPREELEWLSPRRLSEEEKLNVIQRKLSCYPPQPFLGREIDLYRVLNLVLNNQLVSIVGQRGIGRKSLAYAVCRYINERRTTFWVRAIKCILFVRASLDDMHANGFLEVLKDFREQLMLAERGTVAHDVNDDMDSLIRSVCGMVSEKAEKALLVIDGTNYARGSSDQQGLIRFLRTLQQRTPLVKVLLIGQRPLRDRSLPEQYHWLMPLGFDDTAQLFSLGPRLDNRDIRYTCHERLLSVNEGWSHQQDAERMQSLSQALGGGIPGVIVEKSREISLTEIDEIMSGRSFPVLTRLTPEEEEALPQVMQQRFYQALRNPALQYVREEDILMADFNEVLRLNEEFRSGDTALHVASRNGQEDIVLLLLSEDGDPDIVNATNNVERTPLHDACLYGREAIVATLLQRGAYVNARSFSDRTPLHSACARGHLSVMALLLDKGANVDARDDFGCTAIHEAYERHGPDDVFKLLLQRGAGLDIPDNNGRTVLDLLVM